MTTTTQQSEAHPWAFYAQEMPLPEWNVAHMLRLQQASWVWIPAGKKWSDGLNELVMFYCPWHGYEHLLEIFSTGGVLSSLRYERKAWYSELPTPMVIECLVNDRREVVLMFDLQPLLFNNDSLRFRICIKGELGTLWMETNDLPPINGEDERIPLLANYFGKVMWENPYTVEELKNTKWIRNPDYDKPGVTEPEYNFHPDVFKPSPFPYNAGETIRENDVPVEITNAIKNMQRGFVSLFEPPPFRPREEHEWRNTYPGFADMVDSLVNETSNRLRGIGPTVEDLPHHGRKEARRLRFRKFLEWAWGGEGIESL